MADRRHFLTGAGALLASACAPAFTIDRIRRDWPPIGKFVEVGGVRVHHTDEGTGTPVILVHGASGNLRDMTFRLGPEIAKRRRAIAMDRPGYGYSDRPGGDAWDPAVQARLLRDAARALGAERPILVGHSWAGALVLSWALQFPDEVQGALILSGATMPWGGSLAFVYRLGASRVFGPLVADTIAALVDQERIEGVVERVFEPQDPPPGYASYIGGALSTRPETVRANAEDLNHLNDALERQSADYRLLPMPVELVHGTADRIVSPAVHSVALIERLQRGRLTLLPGIGHMPHHVAVPKVMAALGRLDPD